MAKRGYVYIVQNPSMPNIVKIGVTTRSPQQRLVELSRPTGVPENYTLVKAFLFDDCHCAEKRIHALLAFVRKSPKREFFEMSPSDAVRFVETFQTFLQEGAEMGIDGDDESFARRIEHTAQMEAIGSPNVHRDIRKIEAGHVASCIENDASITPIKANAEVDSHRSEAMTMARPIDDTSGKKKRRRKWTMVLVPMLLGGIMGFLLISEYLGNGRTRFPLATESVRKEHSVHIGETPLPVVEADPKNKKSELSTGEPDSFLGVVPVDLGLDSLSENKTSSEEETFLVNPGETSVNTADALPKVSFSGYSTPRVFTESIKYAEEEKALGDPDEFGTTSPSSQEDDQFVTFSDAELESAIRDVLSLDPDARLTQESLGSVGTLNLSNQGLTQLEGIQALERLQNLVLDGNQISDVSPLGELSLLQNLALDHNLISNASALGSLEYLRGLSIRYNRLSCMQFVGNLSRLSRLHLDGNNISNMAQGNISTQDAPRLPISVSVPGTGSYVSSEVPGFCLRLLG